MKRAIMQVWGLTVAVWVFAVLPVRAEVEIKEVTSEGGINAWLVEEPSIPIVAIEMSFRGGSSLDPEGKEGVARFAMGLMDEGAGDLDALAFANREDELSARIGFSASQDAVSVGARFLAETLDESAELLALAISSPRFDPEPTERLRAQTVSGIVQSTQQPASVAWRTWFERAFPGHPYGKSTRGTEASVAGITQQDLRDAHKRLLTRSGAKIGIVGAISAADAGRMVDRLLSGLPKDAPPEVSQVTTEPVAGVHVIEMDVPQSVAVFGHTGIQRGTPDFIAAYVVNHIFGGGTFTSRLTEEVREKRGLAYSVSVSLSPFDGAALYLGSVQTENASIAESLDIIRSEWVRMAAGDLTEEELEAAKKYLTGSFPLRFDSNAKIASYLVFMQSEDLGIDYINQRNALVNAVTLDQAREVAGKLLNPDALSIVVVGKPVGLDATQ